MLRRSGVGIEGRAAVAGTLGEQLHGCLEAQDLNKRRGEKFAERREGAVQKR